MPTPKETVRAVYPRAYCYQKLGPGFRVQAGSSDTLDEFTRNKLGEGKTAPAAWNDAARRIQEGKKG